MQRNGNNLEARSKMSMKDPFQEENIEINDAQTGFAPEENADSVQDTAPSAAEPISEVLSPDSSDEEHAQGTTEPSRETQDPEDDERFPQFHSESRTFAQRMSGAGYVTGRQYDAIKNELLSFRPAKKGKKLRCVLSKQGESFLFGRKTLALLRISGTTLRLFVALNPSEYPESRYHHKDMSETARYARCPMMIRLTSDRQVRHAQELIGILMKKNGLEKNPDYVPSDQADAFGKPRRAKARKIYVQTGVSLPAAETAVQSAGANVLSEIAAAGPVQTEDLPPEAIKARLPRRAAIVDRFGEKIGRLRRGAWYDEEKKLRGEFRRQGEGVLYYPDGQSDALAYLDGNGNLLTSAHKHVATIKRPLMVLIWVLIGICAALAVLSILLGALAVPKTEAPYAPTIFIADETGTAWSDQENLPVFYNDEFGDSVIAPGMSGSYRFVLENKNDDAVEFSLGFSEVNEYGIGLGYRLVRDGLPVTLSEGFVKPEELGADGMTLQAHSSALFELQWYWVENDEIDTAAGEADAIYTLTISFTAAVAGQ